MGSSGLNFAKIFDIGDGYVWPRGFKSTEGSNWSWVQIVLVSWKKGFLAHPVRFELLKASNDVVQNFLTFN
ncbi:hypothetical protein L596_025787 [Steinernema carpocapsae]|uniref:Uncharacterized protein n=1 Tax=Steinernema carpocapsae TaxID=34508 RepID=A0A4U5M8U1_STECR|nr:hypothetical protein L596_025787 [Steinernema carpocapsae]